MNNTFKLGRSIVQIAPITIKKQLQRRKEIITTKLVIIMVIIAIVRLLS